MSAMQRGKDGVWRFTSVEAELYFMQQERERFIGRGTPREEWPEWLRDYVFPETEEEIQNHKGILVIDPSERTEDQ